MQDLPIGIQTFEDIRNEDFVYVDKTKHLFNLVRKKGVYFLSRPRRFGKSLTLSTIEAMFKGKSELFKGLYAEEWVKEQAKNPNPVIKIDMSVLAKYKNSEELNRSIINYLVRYYIKKYKLDIVVKDNADDVFLDIINELYDQFGPVVVLIDEYDKPMTDNLNNLEKANEMRETLRSFYSVLKGCNQVKFLMVTGVSSQDLSMSRKKLLGKIKEYYDGFSFDGVTRVYNPFSVLNFFDESNFKNFWYISGSPSFLLNYLQNHRIKNPDKYEEITVPENFSDKREIESASVESFLYQAGYLTIKKKLLNEFVLGYPNEEVRSSLADMYLDDVYHIEGYISLGNAIWKSLEDENIENLVKSFNLAISGIPYEDFSENNKLEESLQEYLDQRKESWYRSMFVMLLRGAGVIYYAEVHTFRGRSDVVIIFKNKVVVVEFKLAKNSSEVEKKRKEGEEQIKSRDYSSAYKGINKKVINLVLVADDEKRQIVM